MTLDDLKVMTHAQLVAYVMDRWQHYAAQLWCPNCKNRRRVITCHLDDYIDGRGGIVACPHCRPWKAPGWVLANHIEWVFEGGEERYDAEKARSA